MCGQQSLFNAVVVLIEDKASGTQLIQELIVDGCHAATSYKPECDKIMRLHAQTAVIENGFVHISERRRRGSPSTCARSQSFRKVNTTTRWTRPPSSLIGSKNRWRAGRSLSFTADWPRNSNVKKLWFAFGWRRSSHAEPHLWPGWYL